MKRIVTMVVALGVAVAACNGGDSESATTTDPAVTTTEPAVTADDEDPVAEDSSTEASVDDGSAADDATADEPTADEATADEATEEASSDDDTSSGDTDEDDAADEGNDGGGAQISSLDDIPQPCRDLMADFLREIEPLVSTIDWENASLNDFEAIAEDFEAKSDDFDNRGESAGCNDLEFLGDSEFDLMVDFAQDEAPGTIGFLEFISALGAAGSVGEVDDSAGGDAIESCDDGVEFMQGLIDNYDSFADVPTTELLKFQQLSFVFATCTPDQLEFFDSPEVTAFLGG